MSGLWLSTFLRICCLLALTSGIGLWLGHPLLGFALGAALALAWQILQLWQLQRWLSRKAKQPPPRSSGAWGGIYWRLAQVYQRSRKRKRKLNRVFVQLQQAMSAMPDAVVIINAEGQIVWFNPAAEQLLGLTRPQDIDVPITQLLRHPRFIEFCSGFAEDTVVHFPSPVNADITLELRGIPYGKKQRLLLAADVSESQRLEQMRRDFVANASHELRTPLTVIVGYLESLLDDDLPAEWRQALGTMQQQSDRMMHIIEDLLLLSRLESDAERPADKPVHIAAMLEGIIHDARTLSADKQHRIEHHIDTEKGLIGAAAELRSAFSNLLFNAVSHTPAGTQISVRWYEDGQGLHLEVADSGDGIPPQHLPRLSERFYRVDRSRKRSQQSQGTGLGLAIVKHVLQRHGGVLRIHSQVGVGSRFYCDFPLSSGCDPIATSASPAFYDSSIAS